MRNDDGSWPCLRGVLGGVNAVIAIFLALTGAIGLIVVVGLSGVVKLTGDESIESQERFNESGNRCKNRLSTNIYTSCRNSAMAHAHEHGSLIAIFFQHYLYTVNLVVYTVYIYIYI